MVDSMKMLLLASGSVMMLASATLLIRDTVLGRWTFRFFTNALSILMEKILDAPPHPTDNYMLERAFVFIANTIGVTKDRCLSFHACGNSEDPNMLVLLEEDGNVIVLGFDDVEGQLM